MIIDSGKPKRPSAAPTSSPRPTVSLYTRRLHGEPYQTVLEAAGLPRMPFHALRHTAASLLLAQGTHPRVVMELLGHSTIALTMNTYSHVIPELQRDAADKMNAILSGSAS